MVVLNLLFNIFQIGRYDGVVYLKWEKDALFRQIQYGASLGELELEYAKTELNTFFENQTGLIEYFQKTQTLYLVCTNNKIMSRVKTFKYYHNRLHYQHLQIH